MIKEINKMYFNQNDISFKVLNQFPAENIFFAGRALFLVCVSVFVSVRPGVEVGII